MSNVALNEWYWWVGRDEEVYTDQCDSREQALEIVNSDYDTAYICEAIKRPLKLSDQFDAGRFLEDSDDNVYDDCIGENGDTIFEATAEQRKDLKEMVGAAMDAWTEKHKLQFVGFMFTEMRNEEYVESDAYKASVKEADLEREQNTTNGETP